MSKTRFSLQQTEIANRSKKLLLSDKTNALILM